MWNELGSKLWNVYTIETAFRGSDIGKLKGFQYLREDYLLMGTQFCRALDDLLHPNNDLVYWSLTKLDRESKRKLIGEKPNPPTQLPSNSKSAERY